MEAWAIIEKNCKPYGGFVNVITKCGGTLVSQIWIKSMEEYSSLNVNKIVNNKSNKKVKGNKK